MKLRRLNLYFVKSPTGFEKFAPEISVYFDKIHRITLLASHEIGCKIANYKALSFIFVVGFCAIAYYI